MASKEVMMGGARADSGRGVKRDDYDSDYGGHFSQISKLNR
jgi:hypothetical protein